MAAALVELFLETKATVNASLYARKDLSGAGFGFCSYPSE